MNAFRRNGRHPARSRIVVVIAALFFATIVVPASAQAAVVGVVKTPDGACLGHKVAGSSSSGYALQIKACDNSPGQQWTGADDGTVRVENRCLAPLYGYVYAGVKIVTVPCTGASTQKWDLRNGSFGVTGTAYCAGRTRTLTVVLTKCNGAAEQRWDIAYRDTTIPPTTPPTTTPPVTTPPVTTPPVTTPPVSTNPSGVAAPKGDLPGWKQIFVDDFSKPSATGSWANQCDPTKIVYTGSDGQKWRTYPSCYKDTYQKRPYRSDAVLSTHDNVLDYSLRNVDGIPAGASVSPVINAAGQNQTYGRYTARFKVDTPTLSEYYVAWLLWPQSERWPTDGEFDFPEGGLSGSPGGFHHYAGAGSCTNGCQAAASNIGAKFTDWHTYTIEWSPGRVRYILDDRVVLDSTAWVPSTPMRWELQTETNGVGKNSGHLLLDWVSVYSWAG